MPTMPEEQPFGEASTSYFGGTDTIASSSTSYSAPVASRGAEAASPAGGVDYGGGYASGGSLSPVARQDSFSAATGRTGEGGERAEGGSASMGSELMGWCVWMHGSAALLGCAVAPTWPAHEATNPAMNKPCPPRTPPLADSMWASRSLRHPCPCPKPLAPSIDPPLPRRLDVGVPPPARRQLAGPAPRLRQLLP